METVETKKPKAKLLGADGNVFNLIGICSRALKGVGKFAESEQMSSRVFRCGSYDEALQIMMEYCDVE